jgi:ATP-binding cassette subfamily B protein
VANARLGKLGSYLSPHRRDIGSFNTAGDLINRATSDVDNIRRLVGFAVLSLANTLFAYGWTLPAMLLFTPASACWRSPSIPSCC